MNEIVYWLWLSLACTPGTTTFANLIAHFDGPKQIYDADEKEVLSCIGQKSNDKAKLADKDITRAEEIYKFCIKFNVGILEYGNESYPSALRDIPTPPVLLYYRGILPDFDNGLYIATVGTRSLTEYGRKNAFRISYDLAAAGATVVSGMALGIDGVCMAAALSSGAPTVAVLGSGIDVCYPNDHLTLARAIVKNGCILTEYPPKTPPMGQNFPVRNRIISGLCAATIVFEGHERSGALITARHAREQERVVYALPGNVGSKNSEVTNLLMKNGARAITSAEDVIRDFEESYPGVLNPFKLKERCPVDMMSELYRYAVLSTTPGDPIFDPRSKIGTKPYVEEKTKEVINVNNRAVSPEAASDSSAANNTLEPEALKIYKKIPFEGECDIEDLVEGNLNMREVMRLLLKLEMNKFVVILPGEKVKRKTK